jgi:hypothetical protein
MTLQNIDGILMTELGTRLIIQGTTLLRQYKDQERTYQMKVSIIKDLSLCLGRPPNPIPIIFYSISISILFLGRPPNLVPIIVSSNITNCLSTL